MQLSKKKKKILDTNRQQCFDVLDELPKIKIQQIYLMNIKGLAYTQPAADVLNCFLRESQTDGKSLTQQYFDVYKKCDDYKKHNFEPFGSEQLKELVSLGLPSSSEGQLSEKMGNKEELVQAILNVQDLMAKLIKKSRDYKDFKNFILMKSEPDTEGFFKGFVEENSSAVPAFQLCVILCFSSVLTNFIFP